jgi:hypothetical protein
MPATRAGMTDLGHVSQRTFVMTVLVTAIPAASHSSCASGEDEATAY